MFKFGVIDPAKVVRTALQDAASVAGLLITTEAMIAEKPEPKGQVGGSSRCSTAVGSSANGSTISDGRPDLTP